MAESTFADLDLYLAPSIRTYLEERYYAQINRQGRLEQAEHYLFFLKTPHPALWADHGVVHVRDVARHVVQVLNVANGVLIPLRSPERLLFMQVYGVMAAYLHDVGMSDFSPFGRAIHPEYATQLVMSNEFDELMQAIWGEQESVVVKRLVELADASTLRQAPATVLREMLSLTNCHSKSSVPVELLNDRAALRQTMLKVARTDLRLLYQEQVVKRARQALVNAQQLDSDHSEVARLAQALQDAEAEQAALARTTHLPPRHSKLPRSTQKHFERDAYRWLVARESQTRALAEDVIDTLRVLRCADALRQRGAVLKTSGQYEIFIDQRSANAIYALRFENQQLLLLEVPDYISAGEANLASSELDHDGNLRISFHRGSFSNDAALQRALYSSALVVNDIQADVIESFQRPASDYARAKLKPISEMLVLLENVEDYLDFADLVAERVRRLNPKAAARIRTVFSLRDISELERQRYLQAQELDWDMARRREALKEISRSGHKTSSIDPAQAFEFVKLVWLAEGETLIEPGTPAGFVYIPISEGLEVLPLGGYAPLPARAWMPLGVTGVIRGAARNAEVIARCDVSALMIPRDVYIKHWHSTYTPDELTELLGAEKANHLPRK